MYIYVCVSIMLPTQRTVVNVCKEKGEVLTLYGFNVSLENGLFSSQSSNYLFQWFVSFIFKPPVQLFLPLTNWKGVRISFVSLTRSSPSPLYPSDPSTSRVPPPVSSYKVLNVLWIAARPEIERVQVLVFHWAGEMSSSYCARIPSPWVLDLTWSWAAGREGMLLER